MSAGHIRPEMDFYVCLVSNGKMLGEKHCSHQNALNEKRLRVGRRDAQRDRGSVGETNNCHQTGQHPLVHLIIAPQKYRCRLRTQRAETGVGLRDLFRVGGVLNQNGYHGLLQCRLLRVHPKPRTDPKLALKLISRFLSENLEMSLDFTTFILVEGERMRR